MYTQLEQRGMPEPPVNVSTLRDMKAARTPIACLTAYDASYAQLVDLAGVDLVLVGDSLGMVIQGHDTTVPVTVNDIVYHTRAVARGLRRAFLVADMPFMSYSTPPQALENAVIALVAEWNITAIGRRDAPGIYVDGRKLASIGLRIRRACSYHGMAFNIAMDLEPFRRINPCGYEGLQVVAMSDLGGPSSLDAVKPVLLGKLAKQFGLELRAETAWPDLLAAG